jgi:hypothetical protein
VPQPALDRVPLSVWQAAPNDLVAAGGALGSGGDGLLIHYDGASWTQIPTGTQATSWWVFGLSARDVYLVGEMGTILHYDGATVTSMTSGTDRTLYGIWGASANDLWAVGGRPGQDGVLLHKDANGWQVQASPVPFVAYFKVWGSASNDVFVCGEAGTIMHFDGTGWTQQPTGLGVTTTLFTVAGRGPNDVFAVGGAANAVALHYDGHAWTPLPDALLASADRLAGVSEDTDGSVILVGAGGTKLRGKPGALIDDSAELPRDDLHAAWFQNGEIFTVGGNYLAPAGAARHGVVGRYGR